MDAAVIACPRCQRRLQLPKELMAKQVMCPGCTLMFCPNGESKPASGPKQVVMKPVSPEQREAPRGLPQRRSLPSRGEGPSAPSASGSAWTGPVPPLRRPKPPPEEEELPTAELLETSPALIHPTELLSIDSAPARPFRKKPRLKRKRAAAGLVLPLAIGGGVLGLVLVCVVVYFVVKAISSGGWVPFKAPDGSFVVEMPGTPKSMNQGPANVYIVGEKKNEPFIVAYLDVPFMPNQAADAILDGMGQGFVNGLNRSMLGAGGQLTQQNRIALDGHPGRENVINVPGEGMMIVRFYLANSRIYILAVGGRRITPTSSDAQRFFNSFKLTNPQ